VTRAGLLRDRRFRGALLCVLGSIALVAVAPAALAQRGDGTSQFGVVAVDMTSEPQGVVVRAAGAPSDVHITVNGSNAQVSAVGPAGDAGYTTDNVLIIDNSAASAPYADNIKAAAQKFVSSLSTNERVAVISAGGVPQFETGFTRDAATLQRASSQYKVTGGQALYDAIIIGARLLDGQRDSIHSITVITASADLGSLNTAATARAEAISANSSLNFVAVTSNEFPATATGVDAQLASDTGGQFMTTADQSKLVELTSSMTAKVRGLFAIRFVSDQAAVGGNLIVEAGGQRTEVGFIPSAVTTGGALNQLAGDGSSRIAFLEGGSGLALVLILGAVAAALAAYSAGLIFTKDRDGLTYALQPYSAEAEVETEGALGRNALFQRAVEFTGNLAERRGLLEKAEVSLERADLPLRAAEAIVFYAGIIVGSSIIGLLLKRSVLWALIFGVIGVLLPPAVVNFKAKRRRKAFMMQLPDTLQLLAGTLKAGYSFMQGVEAVAQEIEDPMGSELRRVVTEAQLGRPVEEALEASAARLDSLDFAWAVMAVRIQREVGGNLSELLMTVAETMTARQRLRGEVAALTAEGRVSAMVLGILPIGLGLMLWVINGEYMGLLFSETIGRFMLIGSSLLAGAGFLWMKKIIDIKI
jgi:tight adherence protein B